MKSLAFWVSLFLSCMYLVPVSAEGYESTLTIRNGIYLGMPIQTACQIEGQPPAQWSDFVNQASYDVYIEDQTAAGYTAQLVLQAEKNGYLALITYYFDDRSDEAFSTVEKSLSFKYGEPEKSSENVLYDAIYFGASDLVKQLNEPPTVKEATCRTIGTSYIFHITAVEGKDDIHVILYYDPSVPDLINIEGI